MKLSILDQAPISKGQSGLEALENSVQLAQTAEKWGYSRYWVAEHHGFPSLACSAPEVLLGFIGAKTKKIRIGSGAILLPYYKPYKVAEMFHMLATLMPGRIDLGIGRAPGGSAETTNALSETFLKQVWDMPALLKELLHFLDDSFPEDHKFAKVKPMPFPKIAPKPWLLGTSKKSARLAAENGMSYAFGHFMSDLRDGDFIREYKESFIPRKEGDQPEVILTVSAICAETTDQAEDLAIESYLWKLELENDEGISQQLKTRKEIIAKIKEKTLLGTLSELEVHLSQLTKLYEANEIMIVTATNQFQDRLRSYQSLAQLL